MIAAILCPGPSVVRARPEADYLVGVNRAPYLVRDRLRVDEWCFGDGRPYLKVVEDGGLGYAPSLFIAENAHLDITNAKRGDDLKAFPRVRRWEHLFPKFHPSWHWSDWSSTAALVAAADAGARLIRCYGCDWTNDKADPDGFAFPQNTRTPQRWENEGAIWNLVVRELGLMGVEVHRMKPVYVSFYTPAYADHAAALAGSLDEFGLEHDVRAVESRGAWEKNCGGKAAFLLSMAEKHPRRPIVWVDADARIRRRPELFENLTGDIGCHYRDGHELLSGTLFFGPTAKARELLRQWASACEREPMRWDQQALQDVLAGGDWDVRRIPADYVAIFDAGMSAAPVIEHLQASRTLRAYA